MMGGGRKDGREWLPVSSLEKREEERENRSGRGRPYIFKRSKSGSVDREYSAVNMNSESHENIQRWRLQGPV